MWQGGSFGIHDDAGSCMLLHAPALGRSTIVTVRKGVAWRGTPSVCLPRIIQRLLSASPTDMEELIRANWFLFYG